MMQVTEENLQNIKIQKYIKVNNGYEKCTVALNRTERESIEGKMLTLYQCITDNEIRDESGFWIHKDCLEGKKIKKNTFPESDKRKPLNGIEITIDTENSKDGYKFVTVVNGVSRREFLRQKEDIYVKTSAAIETSTTEKQPPQFDTHFTKPLNP